MNYNRNDNTNSKNDKSAFNLEHQTETTGKRFKDANKKINNINGKALIHDNNRAMSVEKNVAVIRDSMIKYLIREGLSPQDKDFKVVTRLGSTTNDMLDYKKTIIRRKLGILLLHSGTGDLAKQR